MRRPRFVRLYASHGHPGRKALAYHEAGHAVAGYALGLEIERLSIIPDKTCFGRCLYRDWESREASCDLDTKLILHLAGPVAEEIAMGAPSRAADEPRTVRRLLLELAGDEAPAILADARSRTEAFLVAHWPVVKAIAKGLRREREIDGDEAMAAIRRALRLSRCTRGR